MCIVLAVIAGYAAVVILPLAPLALLVGGREILDLRSPADFAGPAVTWSVYLALFLLAVAIGGALAGSIAQERRTVACLLVGGLAALEAAAALFDSTRFA